MAFAREASPQINAAVSNSFLLGHYDTSVFEAFRAVEHAVRERAGLPHTEYGVPLLRKAFDPANGPLADGAAAKAEREATASLFAVAIGLLRTRLATGPAPSQAPRTVRR
ncbi:MAG: TIGR02391 family protein [Terriglobales bacterium]